MLLISPLKYKIVNSYGKLGIDNIPRSGAFI